MKKILTAIAALAVASSIFAVDFAASVSNNGALMWGNVVDKASEFNLLGVDSAGQQYSAELLTATFNGEKGGAKFQFKTGEFAETNVLMNGFSIWFQPIDAVKVTLGGVNQQLYVERIAWSRTPNMADAAGANSGYCFDNSAGVKETFGALVEINAGKLSLGLGAGPGAGKPWIKSDGSLNGNYGFVGKIAFTGNFSSGVAWSDRGSTKVLTFGFDVGSWGTPYYGFVQAKLRFDGNMKEEAFMIDNYFKYNFGFMTAELNAPVIFRNPGDKAYETDPSYMKFMAKVTVPINSFSLGILFGSDTDAYTLGVVSAAKANKFWVFGEKFKEMFGFVIAPSLGFNIGSCAVSVTAEVAFNNYKDGNDIKTAFSWGIPFRMQVKF